MFGTMMLQIMKNNKKIEEEFLKAIGAEGKGLTVKYQKLAHIIEYKKSHPKNKKHGEFVQKYNVY